MNQEIIAKAYKEIREKGLQTPFLKVLASAFGIQTDSFRNKYFWGEKPEFSVANLKEAYRTSITLFLLDIPENHELIAQLRNEAEQGNIIFDYPPRTKIAHYARDMYQTACLFKRLQDKFQLKIEEQSALALPEEQRLRLERVADSFLETVLKQETELRN